MTWIRLPRNPDEGGGDWLSSVHTNELVGGNPQHVYRRRILGVFRAWLICECRFRELKFIRKFSNFVESLEILHIGCIFWPIQKIFIFRDFTSSQSRKDQFPLGILVEYWGNTHVFLARALPLKRSSITQNEYFFDRSKPTFSMDNLWTLH